MFSRVWQIVAFTVLCLLGSSVSAAQVIRIEVKSSWDGLGEPSYGDLIISGSKGKYSARGERVKPKAIQALLEALDEPQATEPSLLNCGIDKVWLDSNYEGALRDYTHRKIHELSPEQVELFRSHFVEFPHSQKAFAELFKSWHTDDYPEMSVTVTVEGKELGVQSKSQYPFMLPWFGPDKGRGGYNCHIGQAIAAILPKKFPNRERLVPGHAFRWGFSAEIMQTIEQQWNMLDTEHLVGKEVAPVFALYSPIKSAITCLGSIDVDYCGWNATLNGPALPSNLVIGVSLPYNNKGLSGVQTFLEKLPHYIALLQSVPWLSAYIKGHPESVFELRYVVDRSLSTKALSSLDEDLRKHGKNELADSVSTQAQSSAFIEVHSGSGNWSRLVVLSNRDVLLWHFKGDSVLGFPEKELTTWEYYNWRSTGATIKPDGTLIK